jgi:two-component system cell cycle response regulator
VKLASHASERVPPSSLRTAIGLVLIGGPLLIAAHDWFGLGGAEFGELVNGAVYAIVVLAAGLACLLKARASRRERAAWLAITAAILVSALTDGYWAVAYAGDPTPPFPSLADLGYLAFYPLAAAGIYLLVRARARTLEWRLWMDALIAALGTAAVGAAVVYEIVAARAGGSTAEVFVSLAYPIGDIVLLALVVGIVALTRWRPGRSWALILLGLGFLLVADITTTIQSAGTGVESAEDWVRPIFMLGAICIGAEAWQRPARSAPPEAGFDGWRELIVPGFFAAVMIVLFILQNSSQASPLTTVLWTATMLAVVARFAIGLRENKELLEQVRTDQLTGLGNQGGLRVDLASRVRRGEDEPFSLLLLDLNGFKAFNDTFGHPAGDAMLAQLGRQLDDAIGADGAAYRVGGDEFAALIASGSRARVASVSRRATEALTAIGEDYELGAAWGAVEVPAEATSAAEAMQLADARMYAQKQSRQLAEGPTVRTGDRFQLLAMHGEPVEQRA